MICITLLYQPMNFIQLADKTYSCIHLDVFKIVYI